MISMLRGLPTLWGSFAFLATVRLPLFLGRVDVLIHILCTGVDTVVGHRLVRAGRQRGRMRSKPWRRTCTNQMGSLCLTQPREEFPGRWGLFPLNMDCSGLAGHQLTGCLSRCCNSLVWWDRSGCLGYLDNRCWPTLMSAFLGSDCPSLCSLVLGRSQGRSLRTGEAGCWSLEAKTKTKIVWRWLSGNDATTPGLLLTAAASPSSSGGGMNSPRSMEEGLFGFSKAGASRSGSGRRFLGGGGGTTSSSGMEFEPPLEIPSKTDGGKRK